ncbi:MAG: hypothetical protein ACFBSD_00970 [Paracoccaceae bacterium]
MRSTDDITCNMTSSATFGRVKVVYSWDRGSNSDQESEEATALTNPHRGQTTSNFENQENGSAERTEHIANRPDGIDTSDQIHSNESPGFSQGPPSSAGVHAIVEAENDISLWVHGDNTDLHD